MKKPSTVHEMRDKEEKFCIEYMKDYSATRAAIRSGYSEKTAGQIGYELLQKPHIKERINQNKSKIEELAQISKLSVALELKKLAFSSMATFNNGWMELKDFENLTEDEKAALSEIKVNRDTYGDVTKEYVQLKLHDKLQALEKLIKMFGYNEPEETIVNQTTNIPLIKWVDADEE